jgi:hypothetical protein
MFSQTARTPLRPIQSVRVGGSLQEEKNGLGIKLISGLHLVSSFKNSWSYTATPNCAFIVCTGTILPLLLRNIFSLSNLRRIC